MRGIVLEGNWGTIFVTISFHHVLKDAKAKIYSQKNVARGKEVRPGDTTNIGKGDCGDGRDNHLRTTAQQMLVTVLRVQPISLTVKVPMP
jgi:hypothetical protein